MLRAVVMIGLLLHRAPSTDALEADRTLTAVGEVDDSIPIVNWAPGSDSSSTIAQNIDPQALAAPVSPSSGESSGSGTSESPAPAQSSAFSSTEYSQSSGQSSSEGSDRSFAPRPSRAPTHTRTPAPTPAPIPVSQRTEEPAPSSAESPAAQTSSSSSSSSLRSSVAYDSSPILTPAPAPVPAPAVSARTYSPAPAKDESDNSSTTASASGSSTPAPATTTRQVCLASVSVEGMQSNFCIYSTGKICSSTIKGGLCPGPQPGLERGSYCDMIRSDEGASSNNNSEGTVYGCKLTPTPAATTDTKASEGNHGRGRWVRRQY